MAQSFLETGKQGLFVTGLDIDDAIGMKPGLRQRRRKQIVPRDAPQHLAGGSCSDAGGKECCRRAIQRTVSAAGDLMQRPQRQPSSRQNPVDCRNAEGKHGALAQIATLKALNARSKLGDGGVDNRIGHRVRHIQKGCSASLCKGFLR